MLLRMGYSSRTSPWISAPMAGACAAMFSATRSCSIVLVTVDRILAPSGRPVRHGGARTRCPRLLVHHELGNRHLELAAPLAHMGHLLHDFVLDVPRKDQQVVRPGLGDLLGRVDRNVGAWREPSVLVRVAVNGVVEKVRSDAAVVQQRVAFAWRAVADDVAALLLRGDE